MSASGRRLSALERAVGMEGQAIGCGVLPPAPTPTPAHTPYSHPDAHTTPTNTPTPTATRTLTPTPIPVPPTVKEFRITTDSAEQGFPSISDDYVVWADFRHARPSVYAYDIAVKKLVS
jgi:beta propeller repeat protein